MYQGQSKSMALYSPIVDDEQKALDNITGNRTNTNKSVTCTDDEQPIPSTTEYLETMTHSDSPPGLLPRYSSWSLCCIGRASDYIPTKGKNIVRYEWIDHRSTPFMSRHSTAWIFN
jgi:hypothetical protein